MAAYAKDQEFRNLRWGTGMPVLTQIGGEIVQARARGNCAVAVADPALLTEKVPDPENLSAQVRAQIVTAAIDALGEYGQQAETVAQFLAGGIPAGQILRAQVGPRLAALGLTLKMLSIEAIERV